MNTINPSVLLQLRAKYDKVGPFKADFAIVKRKKKYGIVDAKGNEIVKCKYNRIRLASSDYYYWTRNRNDVPYLYIGKLDGNEQYLIPSKKIVFSNEEADYVAIMSPHAAMVEKGDACTLLFFKNGHILPFEFDAIEPMGIKYFKVRRSGKWGVYDQSGKQIIPVSYYDITDFPGDHFRANNGHGYGVINRQNEIVVPFLYACIHFYSRSKRCKIYYALYLVYGCEFQIYDVEERTTSKVFSGVLQDYPLLKGSVLQIGDVLGSSTFQLMRIDGTTLTNMLPRIYEYSFELYNGLSIVVGGVLYVCRAKYIVNHYAGSYKTICSTEIVNDPFMAALMLQYGLDAIYSFGKNDVTRFIKGQKFGIIAKSGEIVIEPQFDAIFEFWEGKAVVYNNGKKEMIDLNGKIIMQ